MSAGSHTEQAVGLLMEGLLLSYFRATHKRGGTLHVVREYRVAVPGSEDTAVDFAVVDADTGEAVAIFEVARSSTAVKAKRRFLDGLHAAYADSPSPPLLGLVVPDRLASGAGIDGTGVEVVTYAA